MLFLGIISWKGASRFIWGGVVFQMARGFIFKWAVRPMRGIGFDGGFLKKIVGWGATSPLPPTMGNPGQVSQGKSGNLLEDQGKKFLSMQICNFNKKSYASRNVCS